MTRTRARPLSSRSRPLPARSGTARCAPITARVQSTARAARALSLVQAGACAARSFAPLARAIRESRRRVGAMPQHVRMVAVVVPVTFLHFGECAQRLFSSMPAWPKVTSPRPAGSGKACKSTSHAAAETSEPVARMGELASEHWRAASAMSLVSRIFSGIGWPSRLDGRLSLQLDARRSSAHRPSGLRPYHWSKRPAR